MRDASRISYESIAVAPTRVLFHHFQKRKKTVFLQRIQRRRLPVAIIAAERSEPAEKVYEPETNMAAAGGSCEVPVQEFNPDYTLRVRGVDFICFSFLISDYRRYRSNGNRKSLSGAIVHE